MCTVIDSGGASFYDCYCHVCGLITVLTMSTVPLSQDKEKLLFGPVNFSAFIYNYMYIKINSRI
jgi:hypothetical protein